MTRKIVFDTDIGSDVDDALALALALASPELEIVAVTSVGNESRRRAQIARKLLDLAGRPGIPVFAGSRVPLLAGGGFNWFGHEALATLEPGEEPALEPEHAADALLRLARAHDGLEVLLIGPLTNLALALAKEPDLAGRLAGLSIMGGHIRRAAYGGHVFPPGVDYNLCADPHAAQVVLRAGIPTRLVTADVTLQTWITPAELARIEAAGTRFHRVLADEVRAWTPVQKRIFGGAGCDTDDDNVAFLHDPLTVACLYDESFCAFETLEIEARLDGRVLHTVEREGPGPDSFPMRCAVSVDAPRFREHFTARVASLAA